MNKETVITIELRESDLKFLIYALGKAEQWHIAQTKEQEDPDNLVSEKEFREWNNHKIHKCFMFACDLKEHSRGRLEAKWKAQDEHDAMCEENGIQQPKC